MVALAYQKGVLPMLTEAQKAAQHRYRAKQRALGIKPTFTPEQRAIRAQRAAAKRAAAKAVGIVLPSDQWAKKNPDKQRARVARWRRENPEKSAQIIRDNQATRRSTPWGQINNCMWPLMHQGVRRNSHGMGLYNQVLGYSWSDLRAHIEAQFTDGMTWDNWGEVWEVDHVQPVSAFHYKSLADPLFRECWALSNLRPLSRDANSQKGAKEKIGTPIP